jgi:hypothetical protein
MDAQATPFRILGETEGDTGDSQFQPIDRWRSFFGLFPHLLLDL